MNKERLKEIKAEIEAKQKELKEYSREQFKEGCQELFTENPELRSFLEQYQSVKKWIKLNFYEVHTCQGE